MTIDGSGLRAGVVTGFGGDGVLGGTTDEKPAVAESGNTLPPETPAEEMPETELDPMLLLGLGTQFVAESEAQPEAEADAVSLLPGLPATAAGIAGDEAVAAGEATLAGMRADRKSVV